MSQNSITAHCLVKNEARFIWYSVMSVYAHVDKILLYDTGSTDGTLDIIEEILKEDKDKKITFKQIPEVDIKTFADVRQKMLDDTVTNWFIVVDGDEIWWDESIKKVVDTIHKDGHNLESIIVPTYNLVGDIFHYLPNDAGNYEFNHSQSKVKGHYNLRAVNRSIPGLHSLGQHGVWGWVDQNENMIQNRNSNKIKLVEAPYIHATFLQRAKSLKDEKKVPKRAKKLKYEIGISFPLDFYYPEVLFRNRPTTVTSPWYKVDMQYKLRSLLETPFRKIKRKILPGKVGY